MRSVLGVLASTAAALGLVVGGTARASADASAGIALPVCCAVDTVGFGHDVYTLSIPQGQVGGEREVLSRIDPATNSIISSLTLPEGGTTGDVLDARPIAMVAGSIWITEFFHNEVLRVNPRHMTITAHVPTGRSPDSIVSDGSSLWVALRNNRAVVRIDPTTNTVAQRVRVGSGDTSDGPSQVAWTGSHILASMPVSGRVAHIDPSTGTVHYDAVGADAAMCARILPSPGGYWLDDSECSSNYYRWDARQKRITATVTPPAHEWGATIVQGALYTGEFKCNDTSCFDGRLVKRDVMTGAKLGQRHVGPEAFLPHFADGSFWAANFDGSTLERADYF